MTKNISFKKSERPSFKNLNDFPGPCNYKPNYAHDGSQYSIGNTKKTENILSTKDNPGPGHYEIKSHAIEGIQVLFKIFLFQ